MKTIELKAVGYFIYAPPALKAFLDARAKGASKEILLQLSAESQVELEAAQERERAAKAARRNNLADVVIDFNRARQKRNEV
jgi:hypothetical protein